MMPMKRFIVTAMLQDVSNEEIYDELDQAMIKEDGYPYITAENEKMYALLPDMFEFETEESAKQLLGIIKLVCAQIEKKHGLKPTPIIISEVSEVEFSNLEELSDEDFQALN